MNIRQLFGKVIKDSLTGVDGVTYDGLKVVGYPSWVMAILVYIGSALQDVGFGATGKLDYQQFAIGFTTMCGGLVMIAVGVVLKKSTEPLAVIKEIVESQDTTTQSTK